MAEFDVEKTLRWLKPSKRVGTVSRREEALLPFIEQGADQVGGEILLDTTVYIDVLQGRSPVVLDEMLATRTVNHSAVCLGELTHLLGSLDPEHPGTAGIQERIVEVVEGMLPHRLHEPTADLLGAAGILTGTICRLKNYPKEHKRRVFNDSIIFLQGRKLGFTVVTRNYEDFDYMLQIVPDGRVSFYRRTE